MMLDPAPQIPTLDPAGPEMVVVDLRAPAEGDPSNAIRNIVDSGQAACLYDRQGEWSDCVVAKVDGVLFVVTASGRATFSDLGAALRHGLTRSAVSAPKPRRRFRRLLAALKDR